MPRPDAFETRLMKVAANSCGAILIRVSPLHTPPTVNSVVPKHGRGFTGKYAEADADAYTKMAKQPQHVQGASNI